MTMTNQPVPNPTYHGQMDAREDALSFCSTAEINVLTVELSARLILRYEREHAPAARSALVATGSYTEEGLADELGDYAWRYAVAYIQEAWKQHAVYQALLHRGFEALTEMSQKKTDISTPQ